MAEFNYDLWKRNTRAWYNMRSTYTGYRIVKFDELLNVEAVYEMHGLYAYKLQCSCHRKDRYTCRHRQMALIFYQTNRINSGFFYSFDENRWQLPLTESFQRIRRRRERRDNSSIRYTRTDG